MRQILPNAEDLYIFPTNPTTIIINDKIVMNLLLDILPPDVNTDIKKFLMVYVYNKYQTSIKK
jgi:hypothetical protein